MSFSPKKLISCVPGRVFPRENAPGATKRLCIAKAQGGTRSGTHLEHPMRPEARL